MTDPALALGVATALLAACLVLFWPERGLFWGLQRLYLVTDRVKIEDALKHFFDMEYRRRKPTVESLAGVLSIPRNQAADLIARVEGRGMLQREGSELVLSQEGRSYALRIIRVHRLWERYLADETGVHQADWHGYAEEREHLLSPGEANALSAEMGHPTFDPDGDPIPTPKGDVPSAKGHTLMSLPRTELGRIVHIEDEPEAIYSQLVAEGLHPGMRVQVIEVDQERVRFWADGEEHVLAPVFAANVHVVRDPTEKEMPGPFQVLSSLQPGQRARVHRLSQNCRGLERRRLMDLGLVAGTEVQAEMRSPSGDPMAYRVRGALIALRKEQAETIQIEPSTEVAR
jgi:DtxR family transcriptional regulator, Mn-dependent transcriptional regulator